jgi:hypothetical protein
MNKEVDILICYSEADNRENEFQDSGWVSNFKRFLEMMLSQILGEKPHILIKSEEDILSGKDVAKVKVVLAILSERFLQSGPCLDYIEEYYKEIEKTGTNKRLFKVIKHPVATDDQPEKIKPLIGYEMFLLDNETGEVIEIKDFFSQEAERNYWMRMVDLAYDVHECLLEFKAKGKDGAASGGFARRSIFLAETSHDLKIQRNIIKRELLRHGYHVFPDKNLPGEAIELEKAIKEQIRQCQLSIHLIGNSYGEIPKGSERSVVDMQNRLAAQYCRDLAEEGGRKEKDFSRLIWVSPNMRNVSERQRIFIDSIKRDLNALEGAEILQTPLEDFKNIVREELIEIGIEKKFSQKILSGNGGGKPILYLIVDKTDLEAAKPYMKVMEKEGFEVITPIHEGDLLSSRQFHIDNLRRFDLAVIFYGKVNKQWIRMKMLDLLKAPGFGRSKPIRGKALLISPGTAYKEAEFQLRDIQLLSGQAEKEVITSLKSFLEDVNQLQHE